jgi:hypothetical protein
MTLQREHELRRELRDLDERLATKAQWGAAVSVMCERRAGIESALQSGWCCGDSGDCNERCSVGRSADARTDGAHSTAAQGSASCS